MFPAGLRYKYLLWRIWLVPPYALVNMLSLSSRAGRHMRKNANKHIYLKKVCIYHFSWWNVQMKADSVSSNICLGQFVLTGCGWMEGKPFMQTICYTASITQMVLRILGRQAGLSLEKGVPFLTTMLHKSSGWAARDWLHVLWEPTFQQRVCVTVARKIFGDK